MRPRQARFWIGVVLFLLGGVLLAVGGERWLTGLGTTVGLAGLILVGWAVSSGRRSD